jgi:hypothetical protein
LPPAERWRTFSVQRACPQRTVRISSMTKKRRCRNSEALIPFQDRYYGLCPRTYGLRLLSRYIGKTYWKVP